MRGQTQAVLNHLQIYGSITSREAFEMYGVTRLSARIYDFRKLGYVIETVQKVAKNRYGEVCVYAKYVYKGKRE